MNSVPLNFHKMGEGPPLLVLHGLYGMGRNWLTLGKQWAKTHTVYLIDLRNHGQSPWDEEWNLNVMSEDLLQLIQDEEIKGPVLLGHSLGGKVAMMFAGRYYPSPLKGLIVVDISPRAYESPEHHNIINALLKLKPENLKNRGEALDALASDIPDKRVRQFLLTNLKPLKEGGYQWRMNLPIIAKHLTRALDALETEFYDGFEFDEAPTLFIRGEQSDYIQKTDRALILETFPKSQIVTVPQAGHWVHAENPQGFFDVVSGFLERI